MISQSLARTLDAAWQEWRAGRLAQAEQLARAVQAAAPWDGGVHRLLACIAARAGNLEQATALMRHAVLLQPHVAVHHNELSFLLRQQGDWPAAVEAAQHALKLEPDNAAAWLNLGLALWDGANYEAAAAAFQCSAERQPSADAANGIGASWQQLGRLEEAVAAYRQALALDPHHPLAANNLGHALELLGRWQEAEEVLRALLARHPDLAGAHNNLGLLLRAQGRIDEARRHFRRAVVCQPALVPAHSNLLLCDQYRPGVSPADLARVHAEWNTVHAEPLRARWRVHDRPPDPERPLNVGFLSGDFARHPVGYFLVQLLEHVDRHQVHTVCYSDRVVGDDLTERLMRAAGAWRQIRGWSHEAVADLIRADGIDLLFDLAGHTAHNRLLVCALKPAPVQLTWIGYVGTTGLKAIDYLLADRFHVPVGAERVYAEEVIRLPHGYVCYDRPTDAPPVGPLPAREAGHVTFGSFNYAAKLSPAVVALWGDILRRVAGARLLLKYNGLDDPAARRRFGTLFGAAGIDPARVELLGWSGRPDLLATYQRVDVALDPFPYSGGLTTCEALWMGVPVITCPGDTFASRHAFSHLSNVGLTETIAHDPADYVHRAVELARDWARLADLRAGLRQRVADSPLCDGAAFARDWLAAIRGIWRRWCRGATSRRGGKP
ncbi:MAG: tetratricopeptide repeat protein [Gemmataceae bacterium]|nr:tetratricopeptide repeat protein [Gemmataceae bacterium]MDW8265838.1 tetratricopeptide repeat protein [Gemmataceae bacterium]